MFHACWAIATLAHSTKNRAAIGEACPAVMSAIVEALRQHRGDTLVVEHGAHALSELCKPVFGKRPNVLRLQLCTGAMEALRGVYEGARSGSRTSLCARATLQACGESTLMRHHSMFTTRPSRGGRRGTAGDPPGRRCAGQVIDAQIATRAGRPNLTRRTCLV